MSKSTIPNPENKLNFSVFPADTHLMITKIKLILPGNNKDLTFFVNSSWIVLTYSVICCFLWELKWFSPNFVGFWFSVLFSLMLSWFSWTEIFIFVWGVRKVEKKLAKLAMVTLAAGVLTLGSVDDASAAKSSGRVGGQAFRSSVPRASSPGLNSR